MVVFDKCFIMLCTKATEHECIARGLFGDRKWRMDYLREIKPTDIGFLLSMNTDELIGPFVACSGVQLELEPEAWFREFPAQVRVKPMGEIRRLPKARGILAAAGIVLDNLPSGAAVPVLPVQSHGVGEKLLDAFGEQRTTRIPTHG